jgi:F-type H+-transporting ATPase subunit epsilon
MARDITLSIVAPDKSVMEEPVSSIVAPGTEGYFGVQAGHEPLVASLKAGLLEYVQNGQRSFVYIGGGFAEVRPDRVTILADEAELAQNISLAHAEADLEKARAGLQGEGVMGSDESVQQIEKAIQRLRAARIVK